MCPTARTVTVASDSLRPSTRSSAFSQAGISRPLRPGSTRKGGTPVHKRTSATPHQLSYSDFASRKESEPLTTPRLIAMAASLVGDENTVKEKMRCSEADFLLYCAGQKEVPTPELDRLISLLVHEQLFLIAKHREFLAEIRVKRRRL